MLIGLLASTVFVTGCASDKTNKVDKALQLSFDTLNNEVPGLNLAVDVIKARVPMASAERNMQAKTFVVNPNKANIYVYRSEGTFGGAQKMGLEIDGKLVGQTAGNTFALLEVTPGKHTVIGKAENDFKLEIEAQAGKNHFVWQEVRLGFIIGRNKLQLVDEEQGKEGVSTCGLINIAQAK